MSLKSLLGSILVGSVVGIVAGIGYITLEKNVHRYEKECEIYQGYRTKKLGIEFIFDKTQVYKRVTPPRTRVLGDKSLKNELKVGQEYCFVIRQPLIPGIEWISPIKPVIDSIEPK